MAAFLFRPHIMILIATTVAVSLRAEDWPQWRGPSRSGHTSAGARMLKTMPPDPKAIWRIPVGEGFASPVVADGKLLYFDNQNSKETLHAIQASDAKEIWRAAVHDTFQDE